MTIRIFAPNGTMWKIEIILTVHFLELSQNYQNWFHVKIGMAQKFTNFHTVQIWLLQSFPSDLSLITQKRPFLRWAKFCGPFCPKATIRLVVFQGKSENTKGGTCTPDFLYCMRRKVLHTCSKATQDSTKSYGCREPFF